MLLRTLKMTADVYLTYELMTARNAVEINKCEIMFVLLFHTIDLTFVCIQHENIVGTFWFSPTSRK